MIRGIHLIKEFFTKPYVSFIIINMLNFILNPHTNNYFMVSKHNI